MHARRLSLAALAVTAAVGWARPAEAHVSLGLGADYALDPGRGLMELTLTADTPLARSLSVGGRFGALLTTDPTHVGVPIDLRLRVRFSRMYVDGLVGPWIVFEESRALKLHAGFGVGLLTRSISLGVEVGYLDPWAMIGLRLGFAI